MEGTFTDFKYGVRIVLRWLLVAALAALVGWAAFKFGLPAVSWVWGVVSGVFGWLWGLRWFALGVWACLGLSRIGAAVERLKDE